MLDYSGESSLGTPLRDCLRCGPKIYSEDASTGEGVVSVLTDKHRQKTVGGGGGFVQIFDYKMQTDDELSEHTLKPPRPRILECLLLKNSRFETHITRRSHTHTRFLQASADHFYL